MSTREENWGVRRSGMEWWRVVVVAASGESSCWIRAFAEASASSEGAASMKGRALVWVWIRGIVAIGLWC